MSDIKAFIIHLECAKNRQAQVKKLIASLPMPSEIISAIDAHDLTDKTIHGAYERRINQPYYPFKLSRTEIACFLSHRKAWQQIIEQKLEGALIFEDDVAVTDDFSTSLEIVKPYMHENSYIRFPFRKREQGKIIIEDKTHRLIEPCPIGLGQVAQFIGRNCAQELLLRTEKFDRPVDSMLQMFWLTNVHPLSISPAGVHEVSARLGGSTVQRKASFLDKLRREILRPLYRQRIAYLSRKKNV